MSENPELPEVPRTEPVEDAAPAVPPAEVFWGYSELFLFVGLAVPAMLAGFGLVRAVISIFRLHPIRIAESLVQQFVGYFFLFLILVVVFRAQYNRPFWESLGWKPFKAPPFLVMSAGVLAAFAVAVVGTMIRTPTTGNPLTDLVLESRTSMILATIFGVTLGPLAEELAFRGFVQPLLSKSFGAVAGILLSAVPFGVLHFAEYGNSWRHVVLITGAGAAFGWMRQATGSTKASTLMHAAYNALFFASMWSSRQPS